MTASPRRWRIAHSEASLGWGGQEHRVLAELAGFKSRGGDVWLLAPPESEIFRRATSAGIPSVPANFARPRFLSELFRLTRWLRQNRIQVLNPHSSRDGWLLGVAGRLARVPLILRTRHIDVDYPNPFVSRHVFTTFADHVLTTSDKITRHFQSVFQLPDDRITTLPTGIPLTAFSPDGPRAPFASEDRTMPVIGMISVLRSWKGHGTFLEAVAQLKASGFKGRFVIVGEGPIRHLIEKQITDLGLAGEVTLTGHCEDVPSALRALDLLIIASTKHEGVPQIGLQALACKTPVIGSDVGGIPEIIRPGETGRIFPGQNAAALAETIRRAIAEPEATRALAEQGRRWIESRHSLDQMLDQLDQLYRRYLSSATD